MVVTPPVSRSISLICLTAWFCAPLVLSFVATRNDGQGNTPFRSTSSIKTYLFKSIFDLKEPPTSPSVVCVGETLYDSLPDGIFLGGAPTNVAVHLASLGVPTAVVSCVGNDQLGKEVVRRIAARNVDTNYMQFHQELHTGIVVASIDEAGDATYNFDTPAAWDCIKFAYKLKRIVETANVTVIGSLACRLGSTKGASSAKTISTLRNMASKDTIVMDVNLRPPWYDPEFVLALCRGEKDSNELALFKLNDEELPIVESWCGLKSAGELSGESLKQRLAALGKAVNAGRVCVTRGANGAALWCRNNDRETFVENAGYSCEAQQGSDTVGAGDSFLAALVRSLFLEGEPAEKALERACALGGFVASCRGATPDHSNAPKELRKIFA